MLLKYMMSGNLQALPLHLSWVSVFDEHTDIYLCDQEKIGWRMVSGFTGHKSHIC